MAAEGPAVGDRSFDAFYYQNCCGRPYARDEHWLGFFGQIADRIVAELAPKKVLDAGCAYGLLVEALRERGVEAYGIDISSYAIEQAHPSVQPYCRQGSIAEPFGDTYDLIVTIEVCEHMPARDAERAIENMCAHAPRVLFSSSPSDYREPTHINVHPPDYWAERFAQHALYRDVDFDASFVTPWAVLYRRSDDPLPRIVRDYERRFWELLSSASASRSYAIELQERVAGAEAMRDHLREKLDEAHAAHKALAGEDAAARERLAADHLAERKRLETSYLALEQAVREERAKTVALIAEQRADAEAVAAERDEMAKRLAASVTRLAGREDTIANMERSIFWRLRNLYVAVRRLFQSRAS